MKFFLSFIILINLFCSRVFAQQCRFLFDGNVKIRTVEEHLDSIKELLPLYLITSAPKFIYQRKTLTNGRQIYFLIREVNNISTVLLNERTEAFKVETTQTFYGVDLEILKENSPLDITILKDPYLALKTSSVYKVENGTAWYANMRPNDTNMTATLSFSQLPILYGWKFPIDPLLVKSEPNNLKWKKTSGTVPETGKFVDNLLILKSGSKAVTQSYFVPDVGLLYKREQFSNGDILESWVNEIPYFKDYN